MREKTAKPKKPVNPTKLFLTGIMLGVVVGLGVTHLTDLITDPETFIVCPDGGPNMTLTLDPPRCVLAEVLQDVPTGGDMSKP